jgi:uncharacterized cupredoxin-like copper-binding protein
MSTSLHHHFFTLGLITLTSFTWVHGHSHGHPDVVPNPQQAQQGHGHNGQGHHNQGHHGQGHHGHGHHGQGHHGHGHHVQYAHSQYGHSSGQSHTAKREQKAWGIAGDARAVTRTIEIAMSDQMRFTPDNLEIRQGETVKLVAKNSGKIMHEIVIGTPKELEEHAALMKKFPNMEHDEPYMAHVSPGKSGEIIWQFNRAGEFDFACLIAGHFDAGMKGKIKVIANAAKPHGGHKH